MAEVRPIIINEDRVGHVEPLDQDGNIAPVDLTKPWEYQISDPGVVDLMANPTDPLRFTCRFKQANVPVSLIFICHNMAGVQIRCASTYTAQDVPPPPPPPSLAVGGRLVIE